MRTLIAVILASSLATSAFTANAQVATPSPDTTYEKAGEERAVNLCSTCHGPRGISTSPEFPILAAQRAGYLVAQIENFQHKTREEKAAPPITPLSRPPRDDLGAQRRSRWARSSLKPDCSIAVCRHAHPATVRML